MLLFVSRERKKEEEEEDFKCFRGKLMQKREEKTLKKVKRSEQFA